MTCKSHGRHLDDATSAVFFSFISWAPPTEGFLLHICLCIALKKRHNIVLRGTAMCPFSWTSSHGESVTVLKEASMSSHKFSDFLLTKKFPLELQSLSPEGLGKHAQMLEYAREFEQSGIPAC